MSAATTVPREARRASRPLQPIPAGYRVAFENLKQALCLDARAPTVAFLAWAVVARTNGFHVAREAADVTSREFLRNAVGKVTVFRAKERAQAAADKANAAAIKCAEGGAA